MKKLLKNSGYDKLTKAEKKAICNGCSFSPDRIWGLRITEACNIHDYDCKQANTKKKRDRIDARFYKNICILIDNRGGWRWLKRLRYNRAMLYYKAVSLYTKIKFL